MIAEHSDFSSKIDVPNGIPAGHQFYQTPGIFYSPFLSIEEQYSLGGLATLVSSIACEFGELQTNAPHIWNFAAPSIIMISCKLIQNALNDKNEITHKLYYSIFFLRAFWTDFLTGFYLKVLFSEIIIQ